MSRIARSLPPRAVIVTRPTDLDQLLLRHGTRAQARFFLESRGQKLEDVVARTRADLDRFLEAVVVGEGVEDLPLGQGWRRELLGDDLIRLAAGEVALSLNREAPYLRIEERPGG